MPLAGLPHANKYDQKDSPAEKEMRVRTREHVRNEGSRRFKSAPLRQRIRISGANLLNTSKWPAGSASFDCAAAPEKTTLCCVERKMPSNSLLASGAVPSVSFQRVMFPLTVIADPASVSPRTAWIFWYSPSGKKTYPLSVPLGGIVVAFSDKLWICSCARVSAAVWA